MSTRHGFAISGAAFAVLILAAGGVVALSLHQWFNPAHDETHTRHHTGVSRLAVDTSAGDLTITATNAPGREVAVTRQLAWNHGAPPRESERRHGRTLAVAASCPAEARVGFDTCRVALTITVPADLPVSVHADSGDATVRGLSGSVRLHDDSGDVRLADLSGPLRVQVDSGSVRGSGLRSPQVRTSTDEGDTTLTFTAVPDSVSAASSSGSLHVAVPETADGYDVHDRVERGDRNIRVPDRAGASHRIDLSVGVGSLTLAYTG